MKIRYPNPLQPDDLIGVTSPSSGVEAHNMDRLAFAVGLLRKRGFEVEIGACMDGSRHTSATAAERAEELMRMLLDPRIRAVVPPWGGVTAIDLMPYLDFDAIAEAEPTWFVGYSDISTLLMPVTLRSGLATLHGNNLMDTPYAVPAPLLSWLDVASLPSRSSFRQSSPNVHRVNDWDDWAKNPKVSEHEWNGEGTWVRLDAGSDPVDVTGRLLGGCIETLANLAGSPYLDASRLRSDTADSLIMYIEASNMGATTICRHLHGMRLAGFFEHASAILVGRTGAPDAPTLTQSEAVLDALGVLGIPIIGDVECGHVPPQLPIVNGALGRLVFDSGEQFLEQQLG